MGWIAGDCGSAYAGLGPASDPGYGPAMGLNRAMKHPFLALAVALMAIACGQSAVRAQAPAPPLVFSSSGDAEFDSWRSALAARALAAGRDRAVVSEVLSGLRPNPRVVELDQRQPEFVSPVWD